MTPASHAWEVWLSEAAEADFENILVWTADQFGEEHARLYEDILRSAIASLREGPSIPGARPRPDVGRGVYSLHAARNQRRARHFILFHIEGEERITIVRILHDAMDLARHLPPEDTN